MTTPEAVAADPSTPVHETLAGDRPRPAVPGVRYERVPAVTDTRRPFTITIGLTPGYPGATTAAETPLGDLYAAHAKWMCDQIRAGQPHLTGMFHLVDLSYARQLGDTTVACTEAGVRLCGEVSVLYAASVPDDQVIDMLDELAGCLADAAGQERVYVTFRDRAWCLDRHEPPPDDDAERAAG